MLTEWNETFDSDRAYRKGNKNYTLAGREIKADSVVVSARGAAQNQFTVVVAAPVFIYEYQPA